MYTSFFISFLTALFYLCHFPDGHNTVQCFLQSLIILLLWSVVGPKIICAMKDGTTYKYIKSLIECD